MCRSIKTLHNFTPPATDEEIRASSLQFVRKLSGCTRPSKANQAVFDRAVDQVARAAHELLDGLVTSPRPAIESWKHRRRARARPTASGRRADRHGLHQDDRPRRGGGSGAADVRGRAWPLRLRAELGAAFSLRPAVLEGWTGLLRSISSNLPVRTYELATLAAARAIRSSYCSLAHGSVLADKVFDAPTVTAIMKDSGPLEPRERAMMAFAEKVAVSADRVTEADVEGLRAHGYRDEGDLRRGRRGRRPMLLRQAGRRARGPGGRGLPSPGPGHARGVDGRPAGRPARGLSGP